MSTVIFTIFTIDIVSGSSMYWGMVHYLYWLIVGMSMAGTGYAIAINYLLK